MINRIHHIEITVPTDREEAAREFYLRSLGLNEIPKPDSLRYRGGFWVRLDNVDLHVGLEDGYDRSGMKVHVAYQVGDLKRWRKIITELGLTIRESIPIPGYDRFEFRDPFGNRIELIQAIE
ncbi:VOC family protein [bacterium]|nr:VOC family protein [bacterium]